MIYEIIGVAGTGKTTLSQALNQTSDQIDILYNLRSWRNLPLLARGAAEVLPFAWSDLSKARLTRQEWNWMARLQALEHITHRGPERGSHRNAYGASHRDDQQDVSVQEQAILLDQGPIYTLARLSESVAWTQNSARVAHRKRMIFNHWASALNGVIWLDAPTSVLLERIYHRPKWHTVQTMPYAEASAWLDWHKSLYAQTIDELAMHGDAKIHRFDTEQMNIAEIAHKVTKLVHAADTANESINDALDDAQSFAPDAEGVER